MSSSYAPFRLDVTNLTAGWLECEVTVGNERLPLRASFLSDAVEDLARAVTGLLNGADRAACAWAEEPGEYRWVFERANRSVRVRVLRFAETFSQADNDQGECLFELICDPYQVARQVRNQLRRLRDDYGADGYQQCWRHPFPTAALKELERLTMRTHHRDD